MRHSVVRAAGAHAQERAKRRPRQPCVEIAASLFPRSGTTKVVAAKAGVIRSKVEQARLRQKAAGAVGACAWQ